MTSFMLSIVREEFVGTCLWGGLGFIVLRLPFVIQQWIMRRRKPMMFPLWLPFIRAWTESPAPSRLERARSLLRRPTDTYGISSAEWVRLADLVKEREAATTVIVASWLLPGLMAMAAGVPLFLPLGPVPMPVFVLFWLLAGLALGLGFYDVRRYQESEPTAHTVHLALRALDACRGRPPHYEGGNDPDLIAPAVEAFCTALARRAEYVPTTSDTELRGLARTDADLVIKNVQAAKIRLLRGDSSALDDISRLLTSTVTHLVRPPAFPPDMALADSELLVNDPGWAGSTARQDTALSVGLSYATFIACLILIAGVANWLRLPDAVSAIIVPALAAPAIALVRRFGAPGHPLLEPSPPPPPSESVLP